MSAQPTSVLFLRLEGPLQSWGDDSKWVVRHSRHEPSKSGVIGLLAATMGLGLDEQSDQEVAHLGRSVVMAIRADRPGRVVTDYQTVCGGVLSAEGKVKINANTKEPETVESWRDYVADACFLVGLAGPAETLAQLEEHLADPVWTPFLGRKSCPPSAPIWPALPERGLIEEHDSIAVALQSFPWIGRRDENDLRPKAVKAVVEVTEDSEHPQTPLYTRWDVPISFTKRLFSQRQVCECIVPLPEEV